MRSALSAAVRSLLDDPRLAEADDSVRLTSVVLLAKAPVTSARVETMSRDLGGWLGYGVSHVAHTVVPRVRASGLATCRRARDAAGWTHALQFELLPLKEVRSEQGLNPLSLLNKRDLATMLHFAEAVLCPGWAPKDKPATPAGFMSGRRGRGSATDRLAMFLLALEAREDGSVRMAPGRLPEGYSRSEVTVARLLRCSLELAVEVLRRLVEMGAVDWDRPEKFGRDRLLVPAIRAAHERTQAASPRTDEATQETSPSQEPASSSDDGRCTRCEVGDAYGNLLLEGDGWAQLSFEDVPDEASDSACGDQPSASGASPQVGAGFEGGSLPGVYADPHTAHPPVVPLSGSSATELVGFSGSAVDGEGRLRNRACAGEDSPQTSLAGPPSSGKADPLRGEQQKASPAAQAGSAAPPTAFVRPVVVPKDLQQALAPVAWLWAGLRRESAGEWLAKAVRLELVRLRGVVGDALADRRLAERLKRRLDRQGLRPIQDLAGWMIKRGLPQNQQCWSQLCDDGYRLDTAGPCDSCSCLLADRRGLRTVVATQVAAQHRGCPAGEWREVYETQLRARVQHDAAMDLVRRERTAERQVAFRAAVEEQEAQIAAEKAEAAARPCSECGVPEAAGLCPTCTFRRTTAKLVAEAVDVAVAMRADLDDPQAVATLTMQVAHDTWAFVQRAAVAEACDEPVSRAFAEQELAKRVLGQRRERAVERLRESPPAEMEAAHVTRMALRGMFPTEKNLQRAKTAAAKARARVAQELLGEFLGDLYQARVVAAPHEPVQPWSERWADLAQRPLTDDDTAVAAETTADS
jgi:hypothetical protein